MFAPHSPGTSYNGGLGKQRLGGPGDCTGVCNETNEQHLANNTMMMMISVSQLMLNHF